MVWPIVATRLYLGEVETVDASLSKSSNGTTVKLPFSKMPRKIRELIRDLEHAGFANRGGKGNHRNFEHPRGRRVTISGKPGADAKPYQEREVKQAIEETQS